MSGDGEIFDSTGKVQEMAISKTRPEHEPGTPIERNRSEAASRFGNNYVQTGTKSMLRFGYDKITLPLFLIGSA